MRGPERRRRERGRRPPASRKIDGIWTPYNPADYRAYAARQRWFRTPNDAFMTGNFHVEAGLLTKVLRIEPFAPFQLILASTYSGAFHPTAEGQAAIADAVVDKARSVLAKYGAGPDADPTGYAVPSPEDVLSTRGGRARCANSGHQFVAFKVGWRKRCNRHIACRECFARRRCAYRGHADDE